MPAVQGRDGQQVEPAERQVDPDAHEGGGEEKLQGGGDRRFPGKDMPDQAGVQRAEDKGQGEVRRRTREGYEHHAVTRILEIARLHVDRLGPAEHKGAGQGGNNKNNAARHIKMFQGIERQPSLEFGRGIAKAVGGIAMCQFVQNHAEQNGHKRHRDAGDVLRYVR